MKHLDGSSKGRSWRGIDGAVATRYVAHRQKQQAANGTINRELAVLTKMLRLAAETTMGTIAPCAAGAAAGHLTPAP